MGILTFTSLNTDVMKRSHMGADVGEVNGLRNAYELCVRVARYPGARKRVKAT